MSDEMQKLRTANAQLLREVEKWKEALKKAGECGHGMLQYENETLRRKLEKYECPYCGHDKHNEKLGGLVCKKCRKVR